MNCFDKINAQQKKVNFRIKDFIGQRVFDCSRQEWELVGANDLYCPYFVKVKKDKMQKKQYILSEFSREWLINLIMKDAHKTGLLLPVGC